MGKLEGKIALITGGNSGIGLATAKQFVNEGAYVFITGRRDPELAAAVKEIGRNATAIQGDVSNLGDLDRLFAQIKREKSKLDIVFANAGIAKFALLGTTHWHDQSQLTNGVYGPLIVLPPGEKFDPTSDLVFLFSIGHFSALQEMALINGTPQSKTLHLHVGKKYRRFWANEWANRKLNGKGRLLTAHDDATPSLPQSPVKACKARTTAPELECLT